MVAAARHTRDRLSPSFTNGRWKNRFVVRLYFFDFYEPGIVFWSRTEARK